MWRLLTSHLLPWTSETTGGFLRVGISRKTPRTRRRVSLPADVPDLPLSRVTVASAMESLSTRFSATTCSKTCTAPVRRASSTNRSWQPYGSRQGTQRGAAHSSDQTSFSLLRIGSDTLNHCRAPALPSILNLRISFHCETGSPTSARPRRFGKPWTSFYSDTLSVRQNSRL